MEQLSIFDKPKKTTKTFQLHSKKRFEYLVIPVQDGFKLIKIHPGHEMELRLSKEQYSDFKEKRKLKEVFK